PLHTSHRRTLPLIPRLIFQASAAPSRQYVISWKCSDVNLLTRTPAESCDAWTSGSSPSPLSSTSLSHPKNEERLAGQSKKRSAWVTPYSPQARRAPAVDCVTGL